ncbi:MAG: carbohydrate-binding protein, partial [Armatimonadota bacterium]|nr:carbohydrate-binding protein [Armatimonadota bacterium]
DYKSVANNATDGVKGEIRNYTGQGYMAFGTGSSASVRDTVTVPKVGTYRLETRYAVTGADTNNIDLYVNGTKVATPAFTQTATLSDWAINKENITLKAGENTIEFRANAQGGSSMHFDNIVVVSTR